MTRFFLKCFQDPCLAMLCLEADDRFDDLPGKFRTLQHGMGCYIIAQRCCNWSEPCIATCWAQHGLGTESFVEWSMCLRTWSMSSRLCKEWFDLHVHGFHIILHWLYHLYRLPPALCSWLELLVFGDLWEVFIWWMWSFDPRSSIYVDTCGWADREHGALKKTYKHIVSLFPTRYVTDSHLHFYKFKFRVVFNVNDT